MQPCGVKPCDRSVGSCLGLERQNRFTLLPLPIEGSSERFFGQYAGLRRSDEVPGQLYLSLLDPVQNEERAHFAGYQR